MSDNFTDEEKSMLEKLEKNCKVGKWYNMDKNRPDYDTLLSTISKMAKFFGNAEIYDYTNSRFRFIYRENVLLPILREIQALQSIEISKTYKDTINKNKALKSKESMSNFKSIPGMTSRTDIIKEIMDKEEAERLRNVYIDHSAEKKKKLKDWIDGNSTDNS